MYVFSFYSISSFVKDNYDKVVDKNTRDLGKGVAVPNRKIYATNGYRANVNQFDDVRHRYTGYTIDGAYAFSPDGNNLTFVSPMSCNRVFHGCCT